MCKAIRFALLLVLMSALLTAALTAAGGAADAHADSPFLLPGRLACQLNRIDATAFNIDPACHAPSGSVLAVQGAYAYLALGDRLQIIDIRHPPALPVIGELDVPSGARDLEVVGDRLYLVSNDSLDIIDISRPAYPRRMGTFAIPSSFPFPGPRQIEITGRYAYLTFNASSDSFKYRVAAIDISDPYHPVQAGDLLPVPDGSVEIVGTTAYLYHVGADKYIAIYDIADPLAPVFLGVYYVDLQGWEVVGDTIYLTERKWQNGYEDGSEFQIVDVSDPANPTRVGAYRDTSLMMRGLAVSGRYAYVGSDQQLLIFDVAAPDHPTLAGSYDHPGSVVAVAGSHVYVSEYSEGLTIFDISTPTVMVPVGATYVTKGVRATGAVGAYTVATQWSGLWVYDTSDLSELTVVARLPSISAQAMEISGTVAYAASDGVYQELTLVDLSHPLAPVELGTYVRGTSIYPFEPLIAPSGPTVYYSPGAGLVLVIDASDPHDPDSVNLIQVPGLQAMVAASGTLYLADPDVVHIADLADPVTPVITHTLAISDVQDLAVAGDRLYTLTSAALHVWDITAPLDPVEAAAFAVGGTLLVIEGPYATIASDQGVQIIDMSLPPLPIVVGELPLTGDHLFVRDRTLFLSREWEGLSVARFAGVSQALSGSEAGWLGYTGPQDAKTTVSVPEGALSATTVLLYSPSPAHTRPAGWAPTPYVFRLSAFTADATSGDLAFAVPLTLTVAYLDSHVAAVTDVEQLALLRWDAGAWVDTTATCGPLTVNAAYNDVIGPLCQTGLYALTGPTHEIFVPRSAVVTYEPPD